MRGLIALSLVLVEVLLAGGIAPAAYDVFLQPAPEAQVPKSLYPGGVDPNLFQNPFYQQGFAG